MEPQLPTFDGLHLDRTTVAQELLNIDNKRRSNLFPWNGQFSPQLIEILLRTYGPRNGLVLDPFAGSGTVLYEAGRLELPVVGAEINPAAYQMAKTYGLMNLPVAERKSAAKEVDEALQESLPERRPSLFRANGPAEDVDVKNALIAIHGRLSGEAARSMIETLIVLLDFYEDVTDEKVYATWAKLRAKVLTLPESGSPVQALNCDARNLPLREDEADFVVTSPPYINVFNYHQQYRRSAEALGWDLLAVARSEIGSNRKHRQNRFLTVIQYCLDMTDVLRELRRVCKEGSRVVVIVGRESNVRKTRFFNGEIMAVLGSRCVGLSFVSRQERVFRNRFGEQIFEDLLHFDVRKAADSHPEGARSVAQAVLAEARGRAPEESLADLDEALSLVNQVQASPLYDPGRARARSTTDGKEVRP